MEIEAKAVEEYLRGVSYGDDANYVPSDFALEFITFIKLVNGSEGEENKSPVLHYKMLDNVIEGNRTANMCHRGSAKALSLDTQIITPKGNVSIADLAVGDTVFTREGKQTTVTHKSEIFNKPMYEITLVDGRKLKVSEDHLNIVLKRRTGKRSLPGFGEKVLTTSELVELGVSYTRKKSYHTPTGKESKWYVPTADLVEYPAADSPIDPYTVGCILGDGSIDKQTGFTRIHTHIDDLSHFLSVLEGADINSVRADLRRPSTQRFSLKGLGPIVKSFIGTENVYSKRVPQSLLWGSSEQRLAVLRGLMDTDGTVYGTTTSFCSTSPGLINDVVWLVRSLGGEAKVTDETTYKRVYIYMEQCPFLLPRKAIKWKPNRIGMVGIDTILPIPACESQCIAVADVTHSFLAESFFVTHNTTLLAEYLFLYLAVYGDLPSFGKIPLAIYVSDSIENGVKNLRKNIEHRWEKSDFLKVYVPQVKFTDVRLEFTNKDGGIFIVKMYGAKALSLDTVLYTDTGVTTIGEVQPGDSIFGPDGKLTTVTKKSEIFNKPMYELLLKDGRSLKVSEDHINSVVINTNPNNTTRWEDFDLTTKELLQLPIKQTKTLPDGATSSKGLIGIRTNAPVEYTTKDLPVDPYTLGLLLGDGSMRTNGSNLLHAGREDMQFYLQHIPYELGSLYTDTRNTNVQSQTIKGLSQKIRDLSLTGHGDYKFIPCIYLRGSVDQRTELLKGLMDTDGTISPTGRMSFASNSINLCTGVMELVRSLGGEASLRKSSAKGYKVEIKSNECVFKLPRKAVRHTLRVRTKGIVPIISINRIADEPSQCIAVDNASHQFLAGEYVRTHNTGVRGAKEMGKRPTLAVLDDLVSDEDARSATVIASIEDTVYKAVTYALHPNKNKIIWSGTPFNAKDPLYKAVESGAWRVNVFPVCEEFPCDRKDFRGSWPDRFTYDSVKAAYDVALKAGKIDGFNQEMMLRIMSDEDRLITDSDIQWYSRTTLLQNKGKFNFYITTDFATSAKAASDFSVISVWALNHMGQWYWADGICRKQTMDKNVDDLFRLAQMYKPQSVGIEISGQQGGFIPWINEQMMARNIYFMLASEGNKGQPGIRPNTDKMTRFNLVVPWFKTHQMHFPIELKQSPEMIQCMDELTNMSAKGTKSKHDDFSDTISMLAFLNAFKPSADMEVVYNDETDIWEFDQERLPDRISSYIV